MSEPAPPPNNPTEPTAEQRRSALFASLVVQQTNLALLFLGKAPNPDGGQPEVNLDMAGLCIDTLEMLAVKTRGNLEKHEHDLLQQSLTTLRMSFVEAVEQGAAQPQPTTGSGAAAAGTSSAPPAPQADENTSTGDSPKRFVKKY